MKITKQKQQSAKLKIAIIIASVFVILLIAGTVYLIGFKGTLLGWQPFPPFPPIQNETTQDSSDTNHGTKDDIENTDIGTDKTTNQIPVNEALTATFIGLSQSDGYIKFSGSANDSKEGTCSIVFANPNDRPITRTVNATQKDGKAVCEPVQIPETEFSFLGEWTATFRYYINDTQAVAEKKITIQ